LPRLIFGISISEIQTHFRSSQNATNCSYFSKFDKNASTAFSVILLANRKAEEWGKQHLTDLSQGSPVASWR